MKIARSLVVVALLVLVAGCSAGADGTASKDRPRTAVPEGFEHRMAEANGVRLHYVIGGQRRSLHPGKQEVGKTSP